MRTESQPLIRFEPALQEAQLALKSFLRGELYAHPRVRQMTEQAQATVRWLFDMLSADYARMPDEHAERAQAAAARGDGIAAMRVACPASPCRLVSSYGSFSRS